MSDHGRLESQGSQGDRLWPLRALRRSIRSVVGATPGRKAAAARSAWGFAAALMVVVMGSVILVDFLHERAYQHRQALVVADELEQDAGELRDAQDALMSGKPIPAASTEINDELADLQASLEELQDTSESDSADEAVRTLRTVKSAVSDETTSVYAGEMEAARGVAERRTVPALEAFEARVAATIRHYAAAARQSARFADLGLWVALLTAAMAIGGLSWRHERARRAAQAALEWRLRERAMEVAEITERHRQLEALKYTFVSAVSHELRTPLTAIHGSLELLEDGDAGDLPPDAARVVSVAARGTRRLSRLVEDIIDLERLESGTFGFYPATHDLHALLLETVESLTPLSDAGDVNLVLVETYQDVYCDRDRLQQALTNLVGNAIKFTSPGGSIHLETVRTGDEVEVTVRDEGRGIPAEQLEAVFDRFHQVDTKADQAKGGAGLGLAITRHIIEAQGGRIWVESDYGTGTAFRFTLPLAHAHPYDSAA